MTNKPLTLNELFNRLSKIAQPFQRISIHFHDNEGEKRYGQIYNVNADYAANGEPFLIITCSEMEPLINCKHCQAPLSPSDIIANVTCRYCGENAQ